MKHTILRLPAVLRERARSRTVGWPASEVAALNAARIAGKSDTEIQELVARLEAARKAAA